MQEFALLAFVMVLALGAYWAMVIFPKQRDFQKRQQYVRSLNVGDEVVTYGGIIGRVVSIEADEGITHIEIADGVTVRIISAALVQPYDRQALMDAVRKGLDEQPSTELESS